MCIRSTRRASTLIDQPVVIAVSIGLLLTPVFYVVVRRFSDPRAPTPPPSDEGIETGEPALASN
jgi:hypothetical protein